ncbi:unnamed protein product [Rotaria socialis]|uniref:Peptidase S1 domain-containing protein n=1 Tax=Rotaria socialis TaxID=392032 RepID=A0A818SS19_9BILA|nr:unnamed protein product [Rotaria socialis]CAF3748803.1 unnamed protein product [Rotaria socialis]CAF4446350.1 unnamed protein product [Rotaria socialis]CAF4518192.1 unnamed protein product [Rotaria socialis]
MIHGVLYAASIFVFELSLKLVSSTTYTCLSSASCGCSTNSAILTKIVGGEPASSQTWGWAASLRYSASGSHFCGGSIISDSHILTAAHCTQSLRSASSVRVYVGSISLSSTVQIRDVSKIYNHPSYSTLNYLNDIAILKLSTPLNIRQAGVDLVCLPNISQAILASGEYPNAGINLVAIGWGVQTENSQTASATLRQVTVQSIASTNTYCRNVNLYDSSKRFCAGVMPTGGKDTCQGDSGGPLLMFTSNNIWEQVGITSVGYGCARPSYPGIYTRVAAYQSWINATMNHAHREFMISYRMFILVILLILL